MAKDNIEFNASVHAKLVEEQVKRASDIKFQIESFNEQLKEIRDYTKHQTGMKPADFNFLVKVYHTQTRDKVEEQSEELLGVYDAIFTE